MPAHLVPESSYQQLLDSLQSAAPKSLSMIGSLRNVLRGRLKANFYIDQWPDYKAVVCQYIWPRRSDIADIGAYATSSEVLLSVLTEGNLVTWGKRQEFQRIEDRHADYLLEHLKPPGAPSSVPGLKCIHERIHSVFNVMPSYVKKLETYKNAVDFLKTLQELVPDGFVIGRLQPHHAEMVSSQWPRLHGWPNKEPYFRKLIESWFCPALYSAEDFDHPISFIMCFPCDQYFAWTDSSFRGMNLLRFPGIFLSFDAFVLDQLLPLESEVSHIGRLEFERKHGAVPSGYKVKDLVIDSVFSSKL